jgi:phage terminase large subunit-like protein
MSWMRSVAVTPRWSTPKRFEVSDGQRVSDFASTFMHVSKGVRAGESFGLTAWQRSLIEALYERRPDGLLRYRRSLIGLGRKNGKSLLGSLVALYGLIEGEHGAEVYSAAGDRRQARVVFDEAKWQVQQSPALSGICKVYRDAIEVPSTHSVYRVLSSDAKLQQGLNPSTVIFDELHVQPNSELWDALTLGSGARRDPQIVAITTAGYDMTSICGTLYAYGQKVCRGEVEDEAFGFWWWEAPEGCDMNDRDAWLQANPNLAEGLLDMEDMEIAVRQTSEIAVRRYRFNQWVRTAEDSWLPQGAWELCRDSDLHLVPGAATWVGVDMALKRDTTAVVLVQHVEGRVVARAKIWLPEGGVLDVAAVESYLREVAQQYDIQEIAFDPAFFMRTAEALAEDGFPMVEYPQSPQRMVPACGNLYELIVNQRLAHDGNPLFTDQVLSAAQRMKDSGWTLSKGKSKRKIDAVIALAMATDRATVKQVEEPTPGFFVV